MKQLIGKKLGMTQVYTADNVLVPVTVIEAGPCSVVQVKTQESDGYNAYQIGFGAKKEKAHVEGGQGSLWQGWGRPHSPPQRSAHQGKRLPTRRRRGTHRFHLRG